ncbi:MAG: hypothetical protein WAO19_13260 [Candidatus Kryptoniota bacterium]
MNGFSVGTRELPGGINGTITNKWLCAGQLTPIAELDSADNIIARFSGGYMNRRDTPACRNAFLMNIEV